MEALGLDYFALRFPAMVYGTLLILLAYPMARRAGLSREGGLVAAFSVAVSWSLTGFSKSMTIEPGLLVFFALAALAVFHGEAARRWRSAFYVLAGVAGGLAVLTKTSALPPLFCIGVYLLFGPVVGTDRPWRWRLGRSAAYGIALWVVAGVGFYLVALPEYETFRELVLETSLTARAGDTMSRLWLYNAITWIDSQAFNAMAGVYGAIALFLPAMAWAMWRRDPWFTPERRFALGFCMVVTALSVFLLTFIDVPARRLIWAAVLLAVLTGAMWDWFRGQATGSAPEPELPGGRVRLVLVGFACLLAGALVSGWLVSPHGGILTHLTPVFSARVLFVMSWKIVYKLAWGVLGLVVAVALYRAWPWLWAHRLAVLRAVLVFHLAFYVVAAGLWLTRLSYTGKEASMQLGEMFAPGTPVLGADAGFVSFYNRIHPIVWSPKEYRFANWQEDRIEERWDPQYFITLASTLEEIREGAYGPQSPWARSYMQEEIARFPLYEAHGTPDLRDELVVFRKVPEESLENRQSP
jgi:hypothetical protein